MKMSRRKVAWLLVALVVLTGIGVQAIWRPFGGKASLKNHGVAIDIERPDVVIDSSALSRLPRDMLGVPLLRTLLTADFVDYYESNSTRLSADGALRRLAFEHQLDWREEVLRRVFDEPSRVQMWRSPDGRPRYWILSMRRNGLVKLMQGIGNVAAADTQLTEVAKLLGGVPVYALKLAVGRTVLFAAKGDRLVVLSEPGLLLNEDGEPLRARADELAKMLEDGHDAAHKADPSENEEPLRDGHRVVISVDYLSFGYRAFFGGIVALRFEFSPTASDAAGASGWRTAALIDPGRLPDRWDSADLWRAMPANAAACTSLPVNWSDASTLLGKIGETDPSAAATAGRTFAGPAMVCWYAKSTLMAPVFVAQVRAALGKLFEQSIGAKEAKADADAANGYPRLPVSTREVRAGTIWQRPVSARSGTADSAGTPFAAQLSTPRYFPVTLALAHGYAVFSPDERLVDDTLAVLDKRYPALADTLDPARTARTIAVFTPQTVAALIEREAGRSLPSDEEAIFRNAARTHLLPKLHAFAKYPPVSLSLPASLPLSPAWVPVDWHFERPSSNAADALRGAESPFAETAAPLVASSAMGPR
jgi:uncharacterized protein YfaA (DUF2138 family)